MQNYPAPPLGALPPQIQGQTYIPVGNAAFPPNRPRSRPPPQREPTWISMRSGQLQPPTSVPIPRPIPIPSPAMVARGASERQLPMRTIDTVIAEPDGEFVMVRPEGEPREAPGEAVHNDGFWSGNNYTYDNTGGGGGSGRRNKGLNVDWSGSGDGGGGEGGGSTGSGGAGGRFVGGFVRGLRRLPLLPKTVLSKGSPTTAAPGPHHNSGAYWRRPERHGTGDTEGGAIYDSNLPSATTPLPLYESTAQLVSPPPVPVPPPPILRNVSREENGPTPVQGPSPPPASVHDEPEPDFIRSPEPIRSPGLAPTLPLNLAPAPSELRSRHSSTVYSRHSIQPSVQGPRSRLPSISISTSRDHSRRPSSYLATRAEPLYGEPPANVPDYNPSFEPNQPPGPNPVHDHNLDNTIHPGFPADLPNPNPEAGTHSPPSSTHSLTPNFEEAVLVEPLPADDYKKMASPPLHHTRPVPSLRVRIARLAALIHELDALPWVSPRIAADYIPAEGTRARVAASWYTSRRHQSVDLLSGGTPSPRGLAQPQAAPSLQAQMQTLIDQAQAQVRAQTGLRDSPRAHTHMHRHHDSSAALAYDPARPNVIPAHVSSPPRPRTPPPPPPPPASEGHASPGATGGVYPTPYSYASPYQYPMYPYGYAPQPPGQQMYVYPSMQPTSPSSSGSVRSPPQEGSGQPMQMQMQMPMPMPVYVMAGPARAYVPSPAPDGSDGYGYSYPAVHSNARIGTAVGTGRAEQQGAPG